MRALGSCDVRACQGMGTFGRSSAKSLTAPERLDFLTFQEEKLKKAGRSLLTGSQLSFITHRDLYRSSFKVSHR